MSVSETAFAKRATVRESTDSDVAAIQAIYAHHVNTGPASFEEVPPSNKEMAARRHDVIRRGLPYLVAEIDDIIVGYAYANLYRPRPAYRFALEDSIYIDKDCIGRGIGTALLSALLDRCTALGYRQMIAVIGGGQPASIALHARHGFQPAGKLPDVGFKFGKWLDSVLMTRPLGPGATSLPSRSPFQPTQTGAGV
ncbi:MAG: N-acetyltransferase [Rhodospirillales bacterium]|nr:MAG: N-acetyltransferase [Rhodospirillales bacterium]